MEIFMNLLQYYPKVELFQEFLEDQFIDLNPEDLEVFETLTEMTLYTKEEVIENLDLWQDTTEDLDFFVEDASNLDYFIEDGISPIENYSRGNYISNTDTVLDYISDVTIEEIEEQYKDLIPKKIEKLERKIEKIEEEYNVEIPIEVSNFIKIDNYEIQLTKIDDLLDNLQNIYDLAEFWEIVELISI